MEGVRTTPAPTRGRGRGRGGGGAGAGGGPSKRGRGKKDTTGGGGRGAVGAMGGGMVGGAGGMDGMGGGGSTMTDGCEDEGAETGGEQAAAEKPAEMLRVGSLFIKSSIFVHFIDKIRAKKGKSSPSSERYVTQESFWLRLLTVHILHFNSIIKR